MRKTDPDHPLLVDVTVSVGQATSRTRAEPCRTTPKRIYTIGGSVFDRTTGRRIAALRDIALAMYHYKVDPATIRPNPDYKPEPK